MQSTSTAIGSTYGYARVSSDSQNEDRQLVALQSAGISSSLIFIDHKSGRDFKRPAWQKLTRRLKRGDLLVITSIDRMGRNYNDIISEWRMLVKERGVFIRILDMPLIDTSATKGLLSMFISDLVLQILSFVAETEREHIKTRQREGIAVAKARGVKFGRPRRTLPTNFEECANRFRNGEMTLAQAAEICQMPRTTFWEKSQLTSNRDM